MRERTPAMALLTMAVSGLVVAGCADDSASPSSSASAGAPTASAGAGAPVASCVTGTWRTTGVSAQATTGAASANLNGGSGVTVTIGANGETAIDFAKMQPVNFSTTAAGAAVTGTFTFAGQVSATVRTGTAGATPTADSTTAPTGTAVPTMSPTAAPTTAPTGTAGPAVSPTGAAGLTTGPSVTASPITSPSGAADTSGTWEPVPPIDWANTRVTVDLLTPVKVRPVDNLRIADYVGDSADRTGNVVDVEPLLGKGTYQCQGDTLTITPEKNGMGWTLTRA
jgi:hypothetical protein